MNTSDKGVHLKMKKYGNHALILALILTVAMAIAGCGGNNKTTITYASGAQWASVPSTAAFEARDSHTSVVFGNKIWVIGGIGVDSDLPGDVWSSSDGVTWTHVTNSAPFSRRDGHTSVVYDNKMWVIGGYSPGHQNDVWSSSDGETWTQVTVSKPFPARSEHTSVVYNNKMWVIGGDGRMGVGLMNDVWSSSDGATWTQVTPAGGVFPARTGHTSVVYNNTIWVIGGQDEEGTRLNDVWYAQ